MARAEEGLPGTIVGTGFLPLDPKLIAQMRCLAPLTAHFGARDKLFWCEGDNVLLLAVRHPVSLGLSLAACFSLCIWLSKSEYWQSKLA